jgi:hypothetical protein
MCSHILHIERDAIKDEIKDMSEGVIEECFTLIFNLRLRADCAMKPSIKGRTFDPCSPL